LAENPKPAGEQRPTIDDLVQMMVQAEVVLDDTNADTVYANFARVSTTSEEVIIDFALNPNPFRQGRQDLKVTQRLVLNFYTAKRLAGVLAVTLQRLEQMFGPIEPDLRRRVQAQQPPAMPR
jgi:hypothetical protein